MDVERRKQTYEAPVLVIYGTAVTLTQTGTGGVPEAGSQAGTKKRNSLG